MIRAIRLDQELKRFAGLKICMPTTFEEAYSFIIGGEVVETDNTKYESPNVYEGRSRPGSTSQLFKMSLNLDNDPIEPSQFRLEFIEENVKSLMLRNEIIDYYNSIIEIGFEHYFLGLGWGSYSLIVEDWSVSKRIESD